MKAKDLKRFLNKLADVHGDHGNKDEADALRKLATIFDGRNQTVAEFIRDIRQTRKL